MHLNKEIKKNGLAILESSNNTGSLLNKTIDTYNAGIITNEPKEESIKEGLCISCDNRGNCQWEENNKIHCEHYQ